MKKPIFKTTQYPIETLVNDIDHGKVALPDIQRPFVWKPKKVADLFDSIYQGFPTGYLLFWENYNKSNTRNIGVDEKETNAKSLIIDGQQRLTALFTSIKGIPIVTEDYKKRKIQIAFNPLTEEFAVTNPAIEKTPEFINDISILFQSDFSEYRFVTELMDKLSKTRNLTDSEKDRLSSNITRLRSVLGYEFTVLEISDKVDEETVSQIFVRVNSKGVVLKQADFVLTLLSVYWEEGRKQIETFARETRDSNTKEKGSSAYNHLIDADADEILRSIVGFGFQRGRMRDIYSLLRGRDFETREFNQELKEQRFKDLIGYVEQTLDNTNWHDYINLIQALGFKHSDLITSKTNFFYSYAFYLLGKHKYDLDFRSLESVISKWFVFGAITSRYSGSSESRFESDLADIRNVTSGEDFIDTLNSIIESEITNDYWEVTVPSQLESSSTRNPFWLIFISAQIRNNVRMLFSTKKLADLYDPVITPKKSRLDKHHVFPKNYLKGIGIKETKEQNQVANYVYLDYKTNIDISDKSPKEYFPKLIEETSFDIDYAYDNYALPENFYELSYEEFLQQRRVLIAQYIRDYFESLR
jgi:hypothetical protein